MVAAVIICALTCVAMICGILFFPKIKIGKIDIDTYWVITTVGAIIAVAACRVNLGFIGKSLIADTAVNPLKILVLFISMTVLSIFLDELGFFRYLATVAIKHAKTGQIKLFFILYFTVAILTIFTSNDIIILSFTPFICYFAKNARINPVPYLAAEFVAANTWSMLLVIGNPTNIYLATANGIEFLEYIKYSAFPTLFGGAVSLLTLLIVFRKHLKAPLEIEELETVEIKDKLSFAVGIILLAICTLLLAVSSYIGVEMWIVAIAAAGCLLVYNIVIATVRKHIPKPFVNCIKRTPYQLIPFVLSMFVMIIVLNEKGVTAAIGNAIGSKYSILKYGAFSFLASNLINNIPMSVLFSSILRFGGADIGAVIATIVGSNVGAFFTPIGALAGIMWSSIIATHGVKFGYKDFLKIGVTVALPTLFAALGGIYLIVSIL